MRRGFVWIIGLGLCLIALAWGLEPTSAANNDQVETAVSSAPHPNYNAPSNTAQQPGSGQCDIYAVDLIGAWVDAGAGDGRFPFTSLNDEACTGDFTTDVLPLFTTENAWFEGSQACTECHFDNSEDSRHEMDLSSYAGIMLGGDVLSAPPGVAIVVPGDWASSKLRGRLRDNRMPPGWEFDIEETNRDGPLLEHDGGNVYAVELIGAWVDAGAPDGDFAWLDTDGTEHDGNFAADVLPLFTTEDAWFEGSQACTECHFDNSEDSRHEMDLSSYAGIMLGGDVLSSPPGVAVVLPGDWENSKLRSRLRNNRMPPGWEFDIEETNRDGPLIVAGYMTDGLGPQPVLVSAETAVTAPPAPKEIISTLDEAGTAPIPPEIPEATITETVLEPVYRPMFLALFGLLTVVFGVAMGFSSAVQLRKPETQANRTDYVRTLFFLLFAVLAVFSAGLAVHATLTDAFTRTTVIREEVPLPINVVPEVPAIPEVRLEEWQAKLPPAYAALSNPLANDPAAVAAGKAVYDDHDCYECHGENLDGRGNFSEGLKPRPVNLTDPALMNLPFITDSYLFWRISEGGSQAPFFSAMPAWKAYLTETERWQVIAYIRSQVATQMSESDQAAIAVIEQAGCFACHRIEAIGPGWDELPEVAPSRVSGMSAEAYIRQSILEPQAFTVPGFEDQANSMPANFGEKLTAEEIDLLVDFLANLSFDDD